MTQPEIISATLKMAQDNSLQALEDALRNAVKAIEQARQDKTISDAWSWVFGEAHKFASVAIVATEAEAIKQKISKEQSLIVALPENIDPAKYVQRHGELCDELVALFDEVNKIEAKERAQREERK